MKIGFIGTGIMGSRMVNNLLEGGFDLVIYNRTKDKAQHLLDKGADWAESPAAVAQSADIVFTMLSMPTAVEAVAFGEDGLLTGLDAGKIWVDSTTTNPMFARRMAGEAAEIGIKFLEAPVSGSKMAAQGAKLRFWVGGEEEVLATCRPLMEQMGQLVKHMGDVGMGNSLKLVINQMLGVSLAVFSEGILLGESMGIPRETLFDMLMDSKVVPAFVQEKRDNFVSGDYSDTHFPLKLLRKDLQMASETAFQGNTSMPVTNAAKEVFQLAMQAGYADSDYSALFGFLAQDDE